MELDKAIQEQAKKAVQDATQDLLGAAVGDKESLKGLFQKSEDNRKLELCRSIFDNNGYPDADTAEFGQEEDRFSLDELLHDAMTPNDVPMLMPKIVSQIVREAVEPMQVLTPMLAEIRYSGPSITFPSVGGMSAADIGPGMRYPSRELDFGGTIVANIGKSGLKVHFTDEVIRYSVFDVVGLHLRAAGRALQRHKEQKVADLVLNLGQTSFDNSGGTSLHGYTQGRDINLNGNHTITIDDIFVMYADLFNAGFIPNTFIVNPIGWLIFARHSTLRAWAFQNGQAPIFRTAEGKPGNIGPGGVNLGPSGGSGSTYRNINQSTAYTPYPNELFPANLSMVVSPWVTFNSTTNVTDIILLDRSELGVLVTDQPPITEKWDDPARDIQTIKIMERYGLAINNEGEGIVIAKDVSTAKGFDWENNANFPVGTGFLPAITS